MPGALVANIFFIFSLFFKCMFSHSLRQFPLREWTIEQKWMSILLPLLLLYNGRFLSSYFVLFLSEKLSRIFVTHQLCASLASN